MSEVTNGVTRRNALKTAGIAGALGAAGLASADSGATVQVNVGYSDPSGKRAALDAAQTVVREFAFDAVTIEVAPAAAEPLGRRWNVESARPDAPVGYRPNGRGCRPHKR